MSAESQDAQSRNGVNRLKKNSIESTAPVNESRGGSREVLTRTKSSEDSIASREKEERSRRTFGSVEKIGLDEKTGSKEGGSLERNETVRRSGTNKDEQAKRRGAVYHADEVLCEPGLRQRGSSASSGDIVRGSSSDEYKRRLHEMHEKYHETKDIDDGISNRFYKMLTIILAIVIFLTIILAFLFLVITSKDLLQIDENLSHALEVQRFRFGVMSENLDCSIHMKRRLLQGEPYQKVIRQGLMCLYALAPHTVHENSSFQLIFSHTQSYPGMMNELVNKREHHVCLANNTKDCYLRNLWNLTTAYTYGGGRFSQSLLNSVWLEEGNNYTREAEIWSRSFWNGITYSGDDVKVKRRKFKIPSLLLKLANRTRNATNLLGDWNKRFPNIDLNDFSTKDTITISEVEAKQAASIFAYSRSKRIAFTPRLDIITVVDDPFREGSLKVLYPRPTFKRTSTLSFLAAFVVRAVVDANNEMNKRGVQNKPKVSVMSVNALKIAVKHLRETMYWSGYETRTIMAAAHSEAVNSIVNQIYDRKSLKIKRSPTDRVTSILIWERSNHLDTMVVLELSLPHLFDPSAGTGEAIEYPRFVHDDGDKSIPYISSAGVMVTLTKKGETRGIMAASASGSEGAVQGVADAILTMIYQGKAGEAADLKHIYFDLSDGRLHCSKLGNREFKQWYGTACDSIEEDLQEGYIPERKVMTMILEQNYYDFALMAMTQEDDDYNYAVGY